MLSMLPMPALILSDEVQWKVTKHVNDQHGILKLTDLSEEEEYVFGLQLVPSQGSLV